MRDIPRYDAARLSGISLALNMSLQPFGRDFPDFFCATEAAPTGTSSGKHAAQSSRGFGLYPSIDVHAIRTCEFLFWKSWIHAVDDDLAGVVAGVLDDAEEAFIAADFGTEGADHAHG